MVREHKVEHLENAQVRLSITIGQEEVRKAYEKQLAQHAKSIQLKGFRKGHVPRDVIERKLGDAIRHETLHELYDAGLREVLEQVEEKPLAYSQPVLEDDHEHEPAAPADQADSAGAEEDAGNGAAAGVGAGPRADSQEGGGSSHDDEHAHEHDLDLESDLTYAVRYDVYPRIVLGPWAGLKAERPKVSITKEDIQRELQSIQEQNAIVLDKEDGTVAEGDIVTADYHELDENDDAVEGTTRAGFSFTVGQKQNYYEIDDDVIGMASGEVKVVSKTYPGDFAVEDLQGRSLRLCITVTGIRERDLPEIDDELARDVSDEFETLEDLKADVKKRLQQNLDNRLKDQVVGQLVDSVLAASTVPVPESMVRVELLSQWRNLAQQFQTEEERLERLLAAQGRSKEDILAEWRPAAVARLKRQLVIRQMVEDAEISVTDEDLDQDIQRRVEGSSSTFEQARQYYQQNNMLDYIRDEVEHRKLFDLLLEKNEVKAGKKMSLVDVMQGNE